jgi:hypothetical protein
VHFVHHGVVTENPTNLFWNAWRRELEALPALSDEWSEGLAESFAQSLHDLVDRKRSERVIALELAFAIREVHIDHEDLLVFYGIEDAFLEWSVNHCLGEELETVRLALAEWRLVLQKYAGALPPAQESCRSFTELRLFARNAQAAGDAILEGFRALDAHLAPEATRTLELSVTQAA